jgi:5-methylcytosine-specific restriction endonuclease McrA
MAKTATWRNTPFAHKFYHSAAWQKVRAFVWDRAHGLCERCMERGECKPADVVHHIIPLTPENMGDPDISLNPDRLMALCHDCHTEVHHMLGVGEMGARRKEEPRVGFDEEGNVVRLG